MTDVRRPNSWADLYCRAILPRAAALVFFTSAQAAADPQATELALHEPLAVEEAPTDPGVRAGPFLLFPVLGLSETYDDNIFAVHDDKKADFITTLAPSLTALAEGPDHAVRLRAGGQIGRYKLHASENFADGHAVAEGRLDLSPDTRIFGGAWAGRDHEERESANEAFGREPTRYFDFRSYGGVQHRLGRLSLRLGGRAERLDFRDTAASDGRTVNNDDRDRDLFGAGVQAAYAVTDDFEPFLQAAFDLRRYDAAADDNGFARDSDGGRLLAGARVRPAPAVLAEGFAGLMTQDYDDARLKNVTRLALGAALNWTPTPQTRLGAILDRAIDETTLANASGEVETSAALVLRQILAERLTAHLRLGAGRSEFAGNGRVDERVFAGGTLTWRLDSRLSLIGEYGWTGQTSSVDGEAYRRNRVMLGVEGRF